MKLPLFALLSIFLISSATASENKNISITSIIDQAVYLDHEYTSLFKIEIKNKEPCSPKDTVTVSYNISKEGYLIKEDTFTKEIGCTSSAATGTFIPAETGNYTLCGAIINSSVGGNFPSPASCKEFTAISTSGFSCDLALQLKTNETIFYENGQSIQFKPELTNRSFPFVIEYWIEDLFGTVVKPKINTTNTNQKSWKTNIQEQDRVLFLKAVVYPSCNDSNFSNNAAEEMFVVINPETAISSSSTEEASLMNSTINITNISPETISFGEILDADLEIYKGATDKYSISVWAEKSGKVISEKTKIHLKTKNTPYKLTLPVQIEPNCDEKIEDGSAQLVVEGLGSHQEKEITLKGINEDLCPQKESLKGSKEKNSIEIIDLPAEIHSGETLSVKLQVKNDEDTEFEAWSYLYRGSKCYSCASGDRENNKISFSVNQDEEKAAEMLVKADEYLKEGEYNLLVKYRKEDQKTEKSVTQKIYVKPPIEKARVTNQTLPLLSPGESPIPFLTAEKTQKKEPLGYDGIVVYESVSEKSKNLVSWALIIAFGLLSLVLVIRRS